MLSRARRGEDGRLLGRSTLLLQVEADEAYRVRYRGVHRPPGHFRGWPLTRQRTRAFTHLQSHYLFRDRFGRPGKGNDKGKVEALVKTARRKFMVPIPKVPDLEALNERLLARCLERLDALEQGEKGSALLADLDALRDLPGVPFEACEHVPGRVSSTALVRYRLGYGDKLPPRPWCTFTPPLWRIIPPPLTGRAPIVCSVCQS
ncbi:MAG: hypothetical protein OXF79_28905 [Chloroflexi bacterium]|nr:hypothetical protein [Chloroflexota bacterium]